MKDERLAAGAAGRFFFAQDLSWRKAVYRPASGRGWANKSIPRCAFLARMCGSRRRAVV